MVKFLCKGALQSVLPSYYYVFGQDEAVVHIFKSLIQPWICTEQLSAQKNLRTTLFDKKKKKTALDQILSIQPNPLRNIFHIYNTYNIYAQEPKGFMPLYVHFHE